MSKMTRLLGALAACLAGHVAVAQTAKPNILVIFGDDVGYWNVSAYNAGMMGYQTPNIDRTEFPPRQKPGSFNLSDAMDKLGESGG